MNIHDAAPAVVGVGTFLVGAVAVSLDVNTIVLAVIGLAGTSITGYLAMRMATIAAEAKETRDATKMAAAGIEKIHISVNSERSAMMAKVDVMTKQILGLSETIKTMEEAKRGADMAKALASVPAITPIMVTAVTPVAVPVVAVPTPEATKTIAAIASAVDVAASAPTRMGDAIVELKAAAQETVEAAETTVAHVDKIAPVKP